MASRKWTVADAKARLSEVLHDAERGPQVIKNRGREVAVVLGMEEYLSLKASDERAAPASRLHGFLRLSEAIRSEGGATLALPRRRARRSPFSGSGY
jgi:prevent-host-death family protein